MTIKLRGRLFWGFFSVAAAGFVLAAANLWLIGFQNLPRLSASGLGGYGPTGFYTLLAAAGLGGAYAAVVTGLVALKSGKTVSVEIFFFALWAFCQAFELAKLGSVALAARGAGAATFEAATRIALFGRYSGTIAIFSGSLFSVGLKQERGVPALAATLLAGLLFASIHPLNSVGPGRDLLADRGLATLAGSFELAIASMAVVNSILAWKTARDSAYLRAAIGIAMCVAGAMALRAAVLPWIAVLALPVLVAGTWIYIKSMHDYYLWR